MEFMKYQHLERFGTEEVENINIGKCFIFPKLDGTNGSVWLDDSGIIRAGSRNRVLSLDNDNAGFYEYVLKDDRFSEFFKEYPKLRLYGEWLVPHALKTYRKDAWRKFYIFDVTFESEDKFFYLDYVAYQPLLEKFGLDYIAPLRVTNNPDYEYLTKLLDTNVYLIEDGKGSGEGIVIKNYAYTNKYGRITWAKIVKNEFKELHAKSQLPETNSGEMIEEKIINKFVTEDFVRKEYSKIVLDNNGWQSKLIPMLLSKIFYTLITEEIWNILKEFKNPRIDFKTLNYLTVNRIKTVLKEIF